MFYSGRTPRLSRTFPISWVLFFKSYGIISCDHAASFLCFIARVDPPTFYFTLVRREHARSPSFRWQRLTRARPRPSPETITPPPSQATEVPLSTARALARWPRHPRTSTSPRTLPLSKVERLRPAQRQTALPLPKVEWWCLSHRWRHQPTLRRRRTPITLPRGATPP